MKVLNKKTRKSQKIKSNKPKIKKFWDVIGKVLDPELNISIVDLGLVYDISLDEKGNVRVLMTLTTMGCPLFDLISQPIKESLSKINGVKKVEVDLTFDPPWNIDMISNEAKIKLGYF